MVLEKTPESPLDCKETKPVNPKGNQPWIFIRRTDVEAEAPILWPPDARADSLNKTLMLGKIEGRRRRDWQRRRWLNASLIQWTWIWGNFRNLKDKEVGCVTVHGVAKNQTGLSNWTTTTMIYDVEHFFIFLSSVYLIKSLLIYFTHFLKIQMLAFLLLNFMISLYVLDNNH